MAEMRYDIQWTDNDLEIGGGDFVVGPALDQEVGLLLAMSPGHLKADAILGPALMQLLKSGSLEAANKAVRVHLARDDKQLKAIETDGGTIMVDADYK